MKKKYLVKISFSSDDTMVPVVGLVSPNWAGDARIEIYRVADEAWVRKNLNKDQDLKNMELNDKWKVQLSGGEG